ncbi:MFS transporter [Carbonactinospora thermoautotrophica]|uniref:MFS transporter n=1 Tax=Carbonactinospora thermoautotrophica TaxID=1469144 RepID=UPI001FD1DDC2|nr:MFS transporter [Carbonactinospora thermoautotrophica]
MCSRLSAGSLVWAIVSAPEHGWSSARTLGGLAVAVMALVAFVGWERRTPHAMLDLGLFRRRPFTGGSLVIVLMTFAIAGMTFSLTQYLQFVLGYTPLEAGLRTVPLALAAAVSNPVGLQLGRRIGHWVITIAFALMAVAFLIIAAIRPGDGYGHLLTGLIVMGIGGGMVGPTAYTAITTALPKEQAGVGSAVNDAAQEAGNAFGVAVLGSVLSAAYASSLPDGVTGPARESIGAALAAAAARGGAAGQALA